MTANTQLHDSADAAAQGRSWDDWPGAAADEVSRDWPALVVKRVLSQNGKPGGWVVYDVLRCSRESRPFPTREEAEMVRQGLLSLLHAD